MKQMKISMPVRYAINAVLIAVFLFAGNLLISSGVLPGAYNFLIIQIGIFAILAVSLNVAAGYLGQLPLGHAGFMAVGAYAGAIFWRGTSDSTIWQGAGLSGTPDIILGLIVAGLAAAVVGVIIGIPALRLRGDYLAIITLGFGEIIRVVIRNLTPITGGAPGLLGIPRYTNSFFIIYLCLVITCVVIHTMMKSRHGRAILSIRENEIAAESCGVKTTYYKVMAFALSAFFAGVAGALMAGTLGILTPAQFTFMHSIDILVIVVLGGMGSMMGSIIAAIILTSMVLVLQQLSGVIASIPFVPDDFDLNELRLVIYALLLIVVMIFRPKGLMGTYDFSLSHVIERLGGRTLLERNSERNVEQNIEQKGESQ